MESLSLHLERYGHGTKQTIGRLFVLDAEKAVQYDCDSLELPWKNNRNSVSCIPDGLYQVEKRYSPKFKHHFHVMDVPGRSFILIHPGNYYTDIRGCILVGKGLSDINADGVVDVKKSRDTLADLLGLMPKKFEIKIVSV